MSEQGFIVADSYLVRYSEGLLEATDGKKSFSTSPNEELVLEYLKGQRPNRECSANISDSVLTLTFWQNRGKMKLNRVSVMLEILGTTIPIFPWIAAMSRQIDDLNTKLDSLQAKITRQDKTLDEMVIAKEEHQDELLRRVYTVLNSRIKEEPEL